MAKRKSPKGKVSPGWNLIRLNNSAGGLSSMEIVDPQSVIEGGKGPGDIRYGRCATRIYFSYGEPFVIQVFGRTGMLEKTHVRDSFFDEGRSKSSKEHLLKVLGHTDRKTWSTSAHIVMETEPEFRMTTFHAMQHALARMAIEIEKRESVFRSSIDFD
jgi:hypothetical protein